MESLNQAAEQLRQLGLEVTLSERGLSVAAGPAPPYPTLDMQGQSYEFWSSVRFVSNTWIVYHREASAGPDRASSLAKAVALVTALFDDYKTKRP